MAQTILTATGFNRPTLAELLKRIGDNVSVIVGPVNRDPDSGTGQLLGTFAEALGVDFETAEYVFLSRFVSSAEGAALDAIGEWMGNPRQAKTKTRVNVILYGTNGVTVPAGSTATYNNHLFELSADVAISNSNTNDITIRFVATTGNVGVRINSISYAVAGDNKQPFEIATQVAALVNTAGSAGGSAVFSAVANGANLRITSPNVNSGIVVSPEGGGASIIQVGSPGLMTAQEDGPIVVPANLLITPVSAVVGWTGINNPTAGATGASRESDTSYRNRLSNAQGATTGKATPEAIKANMLTVNGVTSATVIVNNKLTDNTEGQPGKSYMVVVSGGLAQDIGQMIWDVGGAGIETFGTQQVTATDSDGNPHVMSYSIVQPQDVYVKVVVDGLSTEEIASTGLRQLIQGAVSNYFATLGLGDDVVPQRMFGYIYSATHGVIHMVITAGLNAGGLSESAVPIDSDRVGSIKNLDISGQGV
jgi:uncharacterized phage protein gp47/JayE